MTKKYTLLSVICALLTVQSVFSQEETTKGNGLKFMPSIGANFGTLSYLGDIDGSDGSTVFTYWKPVYGIYLEKKIGNYFGITANGMIGKVAKNQLDDNVYQNFEADVLNFDINLLFDFDNGKIINKNSVFAPFISVGVGYLSYTPKTDLFDANGNFYYHWNDGTLKDIAQNTPGADTSATILVRDFDYETDLEDSIAGLETTSITVPLRFGLKFKLAPRLYARATVAYILTFTDDIDGIRLGGDDKLFQTSFGLQYNFSGNSESSEKYKDFDFSELDKEDSDKDGIVDIDDRCPSTPEGVKVSKDGCALDTDEDGVADYLDKEPNTPKGKLVTKDGITLTDEMIATQHAMKDSVEVEYKSFTADDLSDEEMKEIQRMYEESNNAKLASSTLPAKFVSLDTNKDNFLSAKEITNAIDQFFEGENNLTAKDLHELIDFYFEQ